MSQVSNESNTIAELRQLLEEALDSVDADEEARRESWPDEIERGALVLDLGDRIRRALYGASAIPPQP